MKYRTKIPVVMYHSVGKPIVNIRKYYVLRCPIKSFESHLKHLKLKGYQTVTLQELYDNIEHTKVLPPKSVVFTFDDGYLDNWTYVYPLLKKYGFNGTIFVSTDFVDPSKEYRPNIEDVWKGDISMSKLNDRGFLSWREMKEMEEDRTIDIQSHCKTHTWYFNSNKIIDFRHPNDNYDWVTWNEYPNLKYKYLSESQEHLVKYGSPVYTFDHSMVSRRYFPDHALKDELTDFVEKNESKEFFKSLKWQQKLFEVSSNFKNNHELKDGVESAEEYEARIKDELLDSKLILENHLKKDVKFLCLPGGGVNEKVLECASEIGYKSPVMLYRISPASFKIVDSKNIYGIRYGGGLILLLNISKYNKKGKSDALFVTTTLFLLRSALKLWFYKRKKNIYPRRYPTE